MTQRPAATPSCMACDLTSGATPLPGGTIYKTDRWVVEHCIGPLRVGSLIVKPIRHVVHLADLDPAETVELGPILHIAAQAVTELVESEQVYVCLWSHADRRPGHIHFVVQPVRADDMERFDSHGPALQALMFASNDEPAIPEVEAFSARAANWFAAHGPAQR